MTAPGKRKIRHAVGYARTSTEEQENGAESQRDRLAESGRSSGLTLEMKEEHASGRSVRGRPVLQSLLARLRSGELDALVVTSLDRLARSVVDFARILEASEREGWTLIVLDLHLDTSNPAGRMVAGVLMQFAQFEREMISDRTKKALAVVKKNGKVLGHASAVPDSTRALIRDLHNQGVGWGTIAKRLNADGVPAPGSYPGAVSRRGSAKPGWHPTSVRRHAAPREDAP